MYTRRTGVHKPKAVSVDGHSEAHTTLCGNRTIWVPDRIVIECRCGEKLRSSRDSIRCRHGVDHTALMHEAARELARNSVVPRCRYYGKRSTRVVYEASEIVRVLTTTMSSGQTLRSTTPTSSGSDQTSFGWETLDNEAHPEFRLEDAIVIGDVDLKNRTIERTLVARNCWFTGKVDLRYCKFEQAVYLLDCTFEQSFNSGDTRESHTVYEKELHCSGSLFKKAASFNGIHVKRSAYFRGSVFALKAPEESPEYPALSEQYTVDFTTASLGENIECNDAQFEGAASFNSIKCGGNAILSGACFREDMNFAAGALGRNLQCSGAKFYERASFNSLKCDGAAILNRALFKGEVNLRFTTFGLALRFEGSDFGGKLDCSSMTCAHDVGFGDARFESAEEVVLTSTTLHGDLSCKRTVFNGNLDFTDLRCDGTGGFQNATFTGKKLDWRRSHFGGDLNLRGVYSAGRFRLGQSYVLGKLRLGGSRFSKGVELYNTESKILELIDANYPIQSHHLMARLATVPEKYEAEESEREKASAFEAENFAVVVTKGAKLEQMFGNPGSKLKPLKNFHKLRKINKFKEWSNQDDERDLIVERLFSFKPGRLNLTDISFERFHGGPNRNLAWELAHKLLEAQDPCRFSRDPYLQLEKYYTAIGEEDDANDMHYEGHCALRNNARSRRKDPKKGRVSWSRRKIWGPDFVWKWSAGYGQKMYRLLILFLVFVAVGTVIFWPDKALVVPPGATPSIKKQQISWKPADRVAYSVDLLLPVLDLRTGDARIPNYTWKRVPQWAEIIGLRRGEILKYYEVFHIFAGWLLIGLLLAWITAKARGS
jgi:hypothetical protein